MKKYIVLQSFPYYFLFQKSPLTALYKKISLKVKLLFINDTYSNVKTLIWSN